MRASYLIWIYIVICCLTLSVFIASLVFAQDSADVAYILKDIDSPDLNLVNSINELGYTVEYVPYSRLPRELSGYKMLLIGNEDFPDVSKIPISEHKFLIISSYNYYRTGSFLSYDYQFGLSKEKGALSSPAKIKNLDLQSPITSGLAEFNAYSEKNPDVSAYYLKGGKAVGIKTISYASGSAHTNADAVIALFPIGTRFLNGKTAQQRGLFFGITNTGLWTPESRQIFKNSVSWLILGEDNDKDGFYTDDDCNDSNGEVNPNATEIPYNGIDDNCDGKDLKDVDADGFDAVVAGGTDCDDNNASINPSAFDIIDNIDQNCRNDAPVFFDNLADYSLNEDENKLDLFNLNSYFADREGRELSFRAEGNQNIDIVIEEGNVSFYPKENWNGFERIKFIASDSELETESNEIQITILPVDDSPFIPEIPDTFIVETELFVLNVKATDPDNETLRLTFNQPLDGKGRWRPQIGDAGNYVIEVKAEDTEGNYYTRTFNLIVLQKVYINEIYASGEEKWVELYNPSGEISLDGWAIENNNSQSQEIEGVIDPEGFFIIELGSDFDIKENDEILLKKEQTLVDSLNFIEFDSSTSRYPDGGSELKIQKPTKGFSNAADLIDPEIELVEPKNNRVFDVREIYFNFTASDNAASQLTCSFYSNINGSFEKLGADMSIENGSFGYIVAKDIPDGNYIWAVGCSDGRNFAFSENRTFTIDALDAPIISVIPDIEVRETESVKIIVEASDQDGDSLSYYINDSRFIQDKKQKNIFEWQTNYESSGEYEIKIRVSDGVLESFQIIVVKVLNVNRNPSLAEIPFIEIQEDVPRDIELTVTDPDFDALSFITTGDEKISCSVKSQAGKFILEIVPLENQNGQASCEVIAEDIYGGSDIKTANINIEPVNDVPIIQPLPNFNPVIKINKQYEFMAMPEDADNSLDELSIEWYVDNLKISEATDSFIYSADSLGVHQVKVVVSDLENNSSYIWGVFVTDKPVTTSYNGGTTDFSKGMNNINLTLENQFGKIEFLEPADFYDFVDFERYSFIQNKKAGLDTTYFTNLANKNARFSFYGIYEAETIYYSPEFNMATTDIEICPSNICKNLTYENNVLSFETKNFGSFFVGPLKTCSALGGKICTENQICQSGWTAASDTEMCCSSSCTKKSPEFKGIDVCKGKTSEIEIQIKEPKEDKEFSIGETIEGSLKIKNNADEDLELEIGIYLYDTENDDELENVEEAIELDENEKETLDFEIQIPEDAEDVEHVIYVKVEGENSKEYCNEIYRSIEVGREKHDVVIQNISIETPTVKPGEYVEISIEALNIGKENEEDAYIEIKNKELGIQGKTEMFNLDDYFGNDNSAVKKFNVKIPEDAEQGEYEISVTLFFETGQDTKTKSISVSENTESNESSEISTFYSQDAEPVIRKSKKLSADGLSKMIVIELFVGIFILTTLIVVSYRKKYYS